MEWFQYPLVITVGIIAGFINTLAGSGSLLSLPLLIFLGLPATVANGTNRIAILFQNIIGASSFHNSKLLDIRGTARLGIPALVGSIVGAQFAVNIDEETMQSVIGFLMVIMLIIIIIQPKRWIDEQGRKVDAGLNTRNFLIFFVIGIYGGFIQAGVGIFLLSSLVLIVGYDIVRANAVKVGIVLLFTIPALIIFIANNHVNWIIGLILALGNMLGARIAANVAVEKGAIWVRRLLIVVVIFSAAQFLGAINFIREFLQL